MKISWEFPQPIRNLQQYCLMYMNVRSLLKTTNQDKPWHNEIYVHNGCTAVVRWTFPISAISYQMPCKMHVECNDIIYIGGNGGTNSLPLACKSSILLSVIVLH